MNAYSLDMREKIVPAYEQRKTSLRKIAERFLDPCNLVFLDESGVHLGLNLQRAVNRVRDLLKNNLPIILGK